MFEYFTREEAELFAFYRIPKELFTNPKYKKLSTDAKLLYGLLLDRNSLSTKNNWFDDERHVYIYFSREEAMELLDISRPKVSNLFKELRNVTLIKEVKQGLTRPNIIYVGKFISSTDNQPKNVDKSTDVKNFYFKKEVNFTSGQKENLLQDGKNFSPINTYLKETEKVRTTHTQTALEEPTKIEVKTEKNIVCG